MSLERITRQSVSLPASLAKKVQAIAKSRRLSANHVLVELIEAGLEAREAQKRRFHQLTDRLAETRDTGEQQRIKDELSKMTFGD